MPGPVALASLGPTWSRIWFLDRPTTPLEVVRIGIGGALLFNYSVAIPHFFTFWGHADWLQRAGAVETPADPWVQSVFFHFTAPWQGVVFHALFLLACAALTVGWRTTWVKWLVARNTDAGHRRREAQAASRRRKQRGQ